MSALPLKGWIFEPLWVPGKRSWLVDYPWSSLLHYQKGNAREWQPMNRVLEAFRLSQNRRGRAAYVFWLRARTENEDGKIGADTTICVSQ